MIGYIFIIGSTDIENIIEGSKDFIMQTTYDILRNCDDHALTFDDEKLTRTTDTIYISESEG